MKIKSELDTRYELVQKMLILGGVPLIDPVSLKYKAYCATMYFVVCYMLFGMAMDAIEK